MKEVLLLSVHVLLMERWADPIEDGVVVITDGRIRTVGPRSAVTVPAGAQIIDVAGKTIMPGIINAHGHVGGTLGLEGGHYNTLTTYSGN